MSSGSNNPTGNNPTRTASPGACEISDGPDDKCAPGSNANGDTSNTKSKTWALSDEQIDAIDRFNRWLDDWDAKQIFLICGQAGTGKTTLARELRRLTRVHYSAYTNKATHVLRTKGCNPATTLHSLLKIPEFEPQPGKGLGAPYRIVKRFDEKSRALRSADGELPFADKEDIPLDREAVLVVDEASMINDDMGHSIEGLPNHICPIMDDFQLPPIGQQRGYFLDFHPDVVLREVHRAKNPGVLDIATHIRQHHYYPPFGRYDGGSGVHNFFDLTPAQRTDRLNPLILQADQIICGYNQTRVELNSQARHLLGLDQIDDEGMPVPGDKLTCYQNGTARQADDPAEFSTIINGSLWSVVTSDKCRTEDEYDIPFMLMRLKPLDNPDAPDIITRVPEKYFRITNPDKAAKSDGGWDIFTYGYAITCHKAQGSEWNNILVIDQSYGHIFKPFQWQWLYTAVTRAAFQTNVIRGFGYNRPVTSHQSKTYR